MDEILTLFDNFLEYTDSKPYPLTDYPGYSIDRYGNVFKEDGSLVPVYRYPEQYDSVYLTGENFHKKVDVHRLVASTFNSDYYSGCVVHHIDGDKHKNFAENLEIMSRSEHARLYSNRDQFIEYNKTHEPWNKGREMSDEYREHCSSAAKMRHERGDYIGKNDHTFHGNQYVDKKGNKR